MANRLTVFVITIGLMIIPTLVFILIQTQNSPYETFELSRLAFASESGKETAGEQGLDEKSGEAAEEAGHQEESNSPNGYSPADEYANVTQSANRTVQSTNLPLSSLIADGSPVIGNHSAPITIVEFGDFQCHFCARFAKQTEPSLNSTYFQTGKANMVFKHFVTHGQDSFNAALASQCANEQGKFWNFYNTLYNNQGEENSGWASIENLKRFASGISGIDVQKFDTCLDSQKYKSLVENDTAFAFASGFQGTPTIIVQKEDGSDRDVLLGAYPFPSFQAIIEKKLSEG